MIKKRRLIPEFYKLHVKDLMDKRVWDLPLIEKDENIQHVLSILSGKSHVWVIDTKENNKLLGVVTEHDVLSVLAPKRLPSYMFGIPDLRSFQFGTAKTAGDVMSTNPITCESNDKIVDTLLKMTKYNIRRLPVVKNRKINVSFKNLNC